MAAKANLWLRQELLQMSRALERFECQQVKKLRENWEGVVTDARHPF